MMKREKIGIKQIDEMIEGGLPKGSLVGLSGPPGVGKSIFALHFLLEGAKQGQKGVYLCLEEPRRNIDKMIEEFSFSKEFYNFEKKGLIVVRCFNHADYEKVNSDLLNKIQEEEKIERVVIDSFNCFFDFLENNISERNKIRKIINSSFSFLRRDNLNVLLILEKQERGESGFDFNIPYLVDGTIKLDYLDLGVIERRIFIPKMRWTNQYKESKSYEIGKKGIEMLGEE